MCIASCRWDPPESVTRHTVCVFLVGGAHILPREPILSDCSSLPLCVKVSKTIVRRASSLFNSPFSLSRLLPNLIPRLNSKFQTKDPQRERSERKEEKLINNTQKKKKVEGESEQHKRGRERSIPPTTTDTYRTFLLQWGMKVSGSSRAQPVPVFPHLDLAFLAAARSRKPSTMSKLQFSVDSLRFWCYVARSE